MKKGAQLVIWIVCIILFVIALIIFLNSLFGSGDIRLSPTRALGEIKPVTSPPTTTQPTTQPSESCGSLSDTKTQNAWWSYTCDCGKLGIKYQTGLCELTKCVFSRSNLADDVYECPILKSTLMDDGCANAKEWATNMLGQKTCAEGCIKGTISYVQQKISCSCTVTATQQCNKLKANTQISKT